MGIEEYTWTPVADNGRGFVRPVRAVHPGLEVTVHNDRRLGGRFVVGGIADLILLNTTGSQFWGFPRDEYTTLDDAYDRMLATVVSARWRFRSADGVHRLGGG